MADTPGAPEVMAAQQPAAQEFCPNVLQIKGLLNAGTKVRLHEQAMPGMLQLEASYHGESSYQAGTAKGKRNGMMPMSCTG